jgi:TetR/AcrR family transcriptional regulator, regulator of autoinduction and epiphytic fitness
MTEPAGPAATATPDRIVRLSDGRTARGERTRHKIVDALLELLAEGDLRATPERIVERAGVSLRTLWTSFKDLEHLYADANARLMRRQDESHQPISPADPLPDRVRRFGEQRGRLLEVVAPSARAAQLRVPFSPQLRRNHRVHLARMRAELDAVFGVELDLAGPEREQLVQSLLTATSWAVWSLLRYELALDLRTSTEVMTSMVLALLRDARPGAGPERVQT